MYTRIFLFFSLCLLTSTSRFQHKVCNHFVVLSCHQPPPPRWTNHIHLQHNHDEPLKTSNYARLRVVCQAQVQQQQQQLSALNNTTHVLPHPFLHLNSDALKHNGSLVTPPSPRSQSSDSGRYRGRRRRSSGSGSGHFRARSLSGE
jgi:hypothetical protein